MSEVQVTKVLRLQDERLWVVTLSTGSVYTYPMYLVRSLRASMQRAIRDEMKVS